MITREIKQHEFTDADFGEEWNNTFFLSADQEIRLHCRYNSTQRKTYISQRDYLKLPLKQQTAFQANTLNPRCFYCASADAVVHAPAAPATVAAKKSSSRKLAESPRKPRRVGKKTGGGRGFNWDSDLGEFIFDELSNLDGYRIVHTPKCLKVVDETTGLYLDQHQLRALRTKLALDRGIAVPTRGRRSNSIRLRAA